jgi:hypothetical protein
VGGILLVVPLMKSWGRPAHARKDMKLVGQLLKCPSRGPRTFDPGPRTEPGAGIGSRTHQSRASGLQPDGNFLSFSGTSQPQEA